MRIRAAAGRKIFKKFGMHAENITYIRAMNHNSADTMRKVILDELKTKFEGVSETILGGIADKLAQTAATEEEAKAAAAGVTFQQVLESYGDSRATGATKTAVLNYERKYGLKDGAKVKVDGDGTSKKDPKDADGGESVPEWAKSLIEQNRRLGERLDTMDRDRTSATRRQRLAEVIGKLPKELRRGYERTEVESLDEEGFDKLLGEISGEVDGIVKATRQKGAVFGAAAGASGGGGNKGGASEAEVKALMSRLNL